jgi:guanylate kinase
MRKPWNNEATGMLAVNNYEEFLKLVEIISESYSVKTERFTLEQPRIVVLVGPSGSGKNEIADILLDKMDCFEKLLSYTTESPDKNIDTQGYVYVSEEEFRTLQESGEMFESTVYANNFYGTRKKDVYDILSKEKHVLTVMDICGAMALKTHFTNVVTIYIKREKRELVESVLEKDIPIKEKVNRLMAIEAETQNAEICDFIVNVSDFEVAAEKICERLNIR